MDLGQEPLSLQLIGEFAVSTGGQDVRLSLSANRQVLGYLCLCPRKSESRSKLAAIVWEDSTEDRARGNLRQALHSLRTDLRGRWDGIEADRLSVSLRVGSVVTDHDRVLEDLRSEVVPDILVTNQRIGERLLTDLEEAGELFTGWLRLRRTEFENTLRTQLEQIVDRMHASQAERAARALLGLDPSDEKAARHLIGHYDDNGETGRALDVYADLWHHLDAEYGMEPSDPTQQLIAAVKSGSRTPRAESPPPAPLVARTKYRIGVQPISASDSGVDAQTTGALFRTELIARLVRFRELDIIDSSLRDTDCDYTLNLAIVAATEHVALIATLTRAVDGVVVWSDRLERLAQNWWEHQAKLAGNLAAACSLNLSRTRLVDVARTATVSAAVDHWLMGQKLLNDFRADSWARSADCLRKAMNLDPDLSMVFSSLSQHHNIGHLVRPGFAPHKPMLLESKVLANRAIALDPLDSRAHLARGWASCMLREYGQAAASFAMARQCNENDPWTVLSSALGAAFSDDLTTANDLALRFLEAGWTSTQPHWGYHANIRFLSGDDAGCVTAAENAGDGIANLPAWKAAALWHLGEPGQAAEAWQRFETEMRRSWAADSEATTRNILHWFLGCFPLRNEAAQARLESGVRGAAGFARQED